MDSDPQILPRTRSSRRKRQDVEPDKSSTGNLEKMLRDVKTNEERNREVDQWSFEFKVMIAFICVAVIGLAALVVWFIWKHDSDEGYKDEMYNKNIPPGMNTANISPELAAQYIQQLNHNKQMQQQFNNATVANQQSTTRGPPPSVTKERMKNKFKKMKNKTDKKRTNNVLGPVPGEKIDNPKPLEKKHISFKDPEVDAIINKDVSLTEAPASNDDQDNNMLDDESERQNAMDIASIYGN